MYEVIEEVKKEILRNKIQLWKNTVYDAGLDVKVAKVLGDKQQEQAAEKRMKNAIAAIEWLEKELSAPAPTPEGADAESET